MRILAATDIIDEIGPEHYASNTTTEALTSPTWISATICMCVSPTPSYPTIYIKHSLILYHRYDTLAPCFAKLVEYYNATSFLTPQPLFTYATNQGFWSYLHSRPNLHADFLAYMRGRKDGKPRWLDYFPISTQVDDLRTDEKAVTLVDIGGNLGHDIQVFQERFPDIGGRLVLQDLKEVVDANKTVLEGIEKVEYDFFTPQPIKGLFPPLFALPLCLPPEKDQRADRLTFIQEQNSTSSAQFATTGRTPSASISSPTP
jgi:hypothetical protein